MDPLFWTSRPLLGLQGSDSFRVLLLELLLQDRGWDGHGLGPRLGARRLGLGLGN